MSKYEQRGAYHYDEFAKDTPYRKHVLDVIEHARNALDPEDTLLDVGAGEGLILEQFTKAGFYCLGCEIDQHAVDIASRKGSPVIKGTITNFSAWPFDCVVAFDVLEHVGDPHDLAARMFDMARKVVMIAVPSKHDHHAVNGFHLDDLEVPEGWDLEHAEDRHARDFRIYVWKGVVDVRTRQANEAIDAMSMSGEADTPSEARAEADEEAGGF